MILKNVPTFEGAVDVNSLRDYFAQMYLRVGRNPYIWQHCSRHCSDIHLTTRENHRKP